MRQLYRIISLSLAIGKEGQNARLAARLTGYQDRHQERETQAKESGELPENYMELGEGVYEEDVYDENEEYPEDADVEVDTEAENETEANVQPEEDGEEA